MNEILHGDCRSILPTLDAGSVRCCVTSPPYWGLRDYGTAKWEGGDDGCDHKKPNRNAETTTMTGGTATLESRHFFRDVCVCGARRIDSQIGLEKTPEEYVAEIVAVFREVRRVLADDGTLWLNLGDSYSGGGGFSPDSPANQKRANGDAEAWGAFHPAKMERMASRQGTGKVTGLKAKDLVGIPWRVAFALQADGWYLRSDIIWHKPNPMPESVTDRPTKSHEYVFLMSKLARYYYDAKAIADDAVCAGGFAGYAGYSERAAAMGREPSGNEKPGMVAINGDTRNARTVWTISTQPTPDAHFATFPEALAERCILAGSAEGDTVLDPFFGSGTVGKVAERLGRKWVGIELNGDYVEISEKKTAQRGLFV